MENVKDKFYRQLADLSSTNCVNTIDLLEYDRVFRTMPHMIIDIVNRVEQLHGRFCSNRNNTTL